MRSSVRVGLSVLCGLAWIGSAAADEPAQKLTADERTKVDKAVKTYLDEMKAAQGVLQPIKDERLEKFFPRHVFYSLLFRQFPAARVPPKGFVVSNVLVADAEGKVMVFTAPTQEMMVFFNTGLPMSKADDNAKDVGRAWVRLVQEFSQDGYYKFVLMDDSTKVTTDGSTKKVTAKVVAMAGGNGDVSITLTLDENGKVSGASGATSLKPGPRPICHATKLLDPDPLVRRIVEQDLLIMGAAAKPYLDEQRAVASPELQQAIDRLWQRIAAAESK